VRKENARKIVALFLVGMLTMVSIMVFNLAIGYAFVPGQEPLTPHTNNEKTIEWEYDDNGVKDGSAYHNHRSPRSFGGWGFPNREPYTATAGVWDGETVQETGAGEFDVGHGFINEWLWIKDNDGSYGGEERDIPDYYFDGVWRTETEGIVRAAFGAWDAVSSDREELIVGIAFQETAVRAQAEIILQWGLPPGVSGLGATWHPSMQGNPNPNRVTVAFNDNPDDPKTPDVEEWFYGSIANFPSTRVLGEAVGNGNGAQTIFDLKHNWVEENSETVYLNGVAQQRDVDYSMNYVRDGTIKDQIEFKAAPAAGAVITADYTYYVHFHFFSTALHEIGHVVGLGDQSDPDDVMIYYRYPGPTGIRSTGPSFDALDDDCKEGARDLYSIPAPDQGDAPGSPYPWASHQDFGFEWLGSLVDGERERKADDNDDGVVITWLKEEPLTLRFTVKISTSGEAGRYDIADPKKVMYLNAWVDWNNDGDWDDTGEKVIDGEKFAEPKELSKEVPVPAGVNPQNIGWARFRLDYGENVGYEEAALYGEVEDYKIKGPPYAIAKLKTIMIPIPEEGRNYGAFTIEITNPTDHAIQVGMVSVTWVAGDPEDTIVYVLDGLVDVPAEGISDPVNLPGFSVGPNAKPGTFPCEIPWSVSVTSSAYGTVNVAVGFKFKTDYPTLVITIIGDINGDFKVDIKDLVLVIKHFGSYPSHPKWNPNADVNSDGKVDIKDLVLVIKHFGEHYP